MNNNNKDNNTMNNKDNNKKVLKPGRTLVVKSDNVLSTEGITGLLNNVQTLNGIQFFVFDTVENSKNAFKFFKESNVKVRFAHYRIFFTMTGAEDCVSYNELKTNHIKWVVENSDANVLYYKQYRKAGKFLGCGDITIDTKESMDKLLDKNGLKNYTFEKYSGTYYRYNKKTVGQTHEQTQEQNQEMETSIVL